MIKNILIIDDDNELCEELTDILVDEGYSVNTAFNGTEGMSKISNNVYDLIILDYKMPGLSGGDVLRFMKEKDINTRVIVVSGKPFIEKQIEDDNMSGFVSSIIKKPFVINFLLEKIKTY
ncbi:MAG: response regulator [Elusimicrobiota bacterium]